MPKVAIVGAGIVGLSVALETLDSFGDGAVEVTIIAEQFYSQTLSFGSGGLWEPYAIAGTPDSLINAWGKRAFDHFMQLHHSVDANLTGIQLMQCYNLYQEGDDQTPPAWRDIVIGYSPLTRKDLDKMSLPERFIGGYTFNTIVIDQKYYLKYLTERLMERGVRFVQRRVERLTDLKDEGYDAVVNCTGLGAMGVANDPEMYPIRGQVLRVKAPWMKCVWFWGKSYIIPNMDNVVIGGTTQKGNWNTTATLEDTERIVGDISEVFPAFRNVAIDNIWVGLRPGRTPLRLESERLPTGGGGEGPSEDMFVVHCYGHGGSGITLAMGCAFDVVKNHLQPHLFGFSSSSSSSVTSRL